MSMKTKEKTVELVLPVLAQHSRKKEYALPWEAPMATHDIYKAGEYMVWTDHRIYKCVTDTGFSPVDAPNAWEQVEE